MKIVVLDGYTLNPGDISWGALCALGEVEVFDRTSPDQVLERSKGARVLLTNKVPLTKAMLEALPDLKYIGVMATGYNVIDIDAATNLGIIVTNIPTYGTNAVAQHTFALLLAMTIHPESHSETVKAGKWSSCLDYCYWDYPLSEIAGKTIGIVGYGRIGQAVGKIAQAFGMKVLAHDNYRNPSFENENMKYVELDELYAESDVISLHCPLFESNRGMINKDSIAKMKDGVKIINTSRGPLVVDEDLAVALNSGKVGAAGLDVLMVEPPKVDNPLFTAKNSIITPHIAWAPQESRMRLMAIAVDNLANYIDGKPINIVNKK
jgi:glycerate dehydrogenase